MTKKQKIYWSIVYIASIVGLLISMIDKDVYTLILSLYVATLSVYKLGAFEK